MKRLLLFFGIHSKIPRGKELIKMAWELGISAKDLSVPDAPCDPSDIKLSGSEEPKLQSRIREELAHRRQVWLPAIAAVFSAIAAVASAFSATASWWAVLRNP